LSCSPIIQTIREIDKLDKDEGLHTYIKTGFGSAEKLKKIILFDFFRNAFDGSGADNFFDAGASYARVPVISAFSFRVFRHCTQTMHMITASHDAAVSFAGSCIDGRLTSAWNWCATLPEKEFYPVFLLSGFIGFDGEFQE
jgi:hypothetical protein